MVIHGTEILVQREKEVQMEIHAYVKNGKFCVVNNTYEPQKTVIYRGDGSSFPLELESNEIKWYNISIAD